MTKQEIYDTIVSLTAEIKTTNVGLKLFEAAKSDGRKVKEVAETFKKEYSELYQRMDSFANKFNILMEVSITGCEGEIFGDEEDKVNGISVFDAKIIDVASFFAITFLTGIDAAYLFTGTVIELEFDMFATDDSAYLEALEKESGSYDLVEFLRGGAAFSGEELEVLQECGFEYWNIYDLLADVFAGKLKEYVA